MATDKSSDEALLARFDRISVYSRGEVRAVHKPLLLLLALAEAKPGGERWLRFNGTSQRLGELIEKFGSASKNTRTDYPYMRLANDGVWELPEADALRAKMNKRGMVPVKVLRDLDAQAGFPKDIHEQLSERPDLVDKVAQRIVERNFPEAKRREVLAVVGVSSPGSK